MATQFSLYRPCDTFLYRLNPFTKLSLSTCFILLTFLAPGYWTPWFLAGVSFFLAIINQLVKPFLKILLQIILPLAFFLFIIHGFFSPNGQIEIIIVGPFSLKLEGLEFALLITGRIVSAVGASLLLVFTTPPTSLMLALVQHGVSDLLTYIIGTTLQIIPQMRMRAAAITAAQQSRGLETTGSLIVRLRALLPLITPLILSSLIDVEERAIALEVRAFRADGAKTSLIDLPDSIWERVFRWLAFGATVLIISIGWFWQ